MTRDQIIERLQDVDSRSLACPVCQGPTGVLYTRHPQDHTTRRRLCGRCRLEFTTCERIVGGYTREDLELARQNYDAWKRIHETGSDGVCTPIAPNQRTLFEIEELELDTP